MISIIVRTLNEASWLPHLFYALRHQSYQEHEVILVDNDSTDDTVAIARKNGAIIVSIDKQNFTYGSSLNVGIRASKGKYLAMISGHCVPVDNLWLQNLERNFTSPDIVGVYGRQLPLPDSTDFDKRDLWTTFGIERKVQTKDFFFHNANAMIRRSTWERFPFDGQTKGVEDRIWAKPMIEKGHTIVYEPEAIVYHQHGIHQGRDEKRANRVVNVIKQIY